MTHQEKRAWIMLVVSAAAYAAMVLSRTGGHPLTRVPYAAALLWTVGASIAAEVVVALRGERTLTVTAPGSPPLDLVPLGALRFGMKDQPAVTAEFELDGDGAVTRLVAQPLGIFLPKEAS